MSFIQRYGRCIYAGITPEPNPNLEELENLELLQEILLEEGDYVDLGLESGTLWRNMNLGASEPTSRGAYFSWGNLEGYVASYTEGEYEGTIVGYSFTSDTYALTDAANEEIGFQDAATDSLSDGWEIPTTTLFLELIDNCTIEWVTINEVPGKLFTSNINGKKLFLPNNGYGNAETLSSPGFQSAYWTNTEDENDTSKAYAFALSTSILPNLTPVHAEEKRFGFGIRPVKHTL